MAWQRCLFDLTAFVALLGLLGILGWIDYAMARTPPPVPLEQEPPPLVKRAKQTFQSKQSVGKTATLRVLWKAVFFNKDPRSSKVVAAQERTCLSERVT